MSATLKQDHRSPSDGQEQKQMSISSLGSKAEVGRQQSAETNSVVLQTRNGFTLHASADEKKHTLVSVPLKNKVMIGRRLLGIQLELFSALVYHYPYCLAQDSRQIYQNCQDEYQRCSLLYQQSLADKYLNIFATCKHTHAQLHAHLLKLINTHLDGTADEKFTEIFYKMKFVDFFQASEKMLVDSAAFMLRLEQPVTAAGNKEMQNILQKIEEDYTKQRKQFELQIEKFKQELIKDNSLRKLKGPLITLAWLRRPWQLAIKPKDLQVMDCKALGITVTNEEILQLKLAQHAVCAMRAALSKSEQLFEPLSDPVVLPANAWLKAADYVDLLLLSKLLQQPQQILEALERQSAFLVACYNDLRAKVLNFIKRELGEFFDEIMRVQRTILFYQRWQQYLEQFVENVSKIKDGGAKNLSAMRCLTYDKKIFFKLALAPEQEQAHLVVTTVYQMLINGVQSGSHLLKSLQAQNKFLQKAIAAKEEALKGNISFWDTIQIKFLLSVTQQPDFQLGQVSQAWTVRQMFSNVDPTIQKSSEKVVGSVFFGGALAGSYYVGYGAHWIAGLNRVIGAEITTILQVGRILDWVSCRVGVPIIERLERGLIRKSPWLIWLKRVIRFDEIGIMEKDSYLQWLNGLVTSLMMSSQYLLPATAAYSAATIAGQAVNDWVDIAGETMGVAPQNTAVAKLLTHMAIYSATYKKAFDTTHYFFSSKALVPFYYPKDVKQIQRELDARETLECNSTASKDAIRASYRRLSKINHWDHCKTSECASKMQKIVAAYEILGPQH